MSFPDETRSPCFRTASYSPDTCAMLFLNVQNFHVQAGKVEIFLGSGCVKKEEKKKEERKKERKNDTETKI